MSKKVYVATALTMGLAGYALAQEAASPVPAAAPAAPIAHEVHHQTAPARAAPMAHEMNHQLAPAGPSLSHYILIMISFINNGNPQVISPTTQTIIGTAYPTPDSCGKAAQGAWGAAPEPTTQLKKETDMLRLYFVCVESDK
jgi:hypothetical protein